MNTTNTTTNNSSKNTGPSDNAQKIFAMQYEETEKKPIIETFNVLGRTVVWREQSVVINPQNIAEVDATLYDEEDDSYYPGKIPNVVRFFTKSEAGGMMSAVAAAHSGEYEVLEIGAHFYKAEKPKAFQQEIVGYITWLYEGDNPNFLRLKPESGVNVIGYKAGAYYISDRIPTMDYSHAQGEPAYVTKRRRQYWKHVGMDLFLTGQPVFCSPTFKNAEGEIDTVRRANYIGTIMSSLALTPEEATQAYEAQVQRKRSIGHEAALYKALKDGRMNMTITEEEFWSTNIKVGNDVVTVKDLLGREIFKYSGNVRLNNKPLTVTDKNIKQVVAMVERSTRIEFAPVVS